MAYFQLDSMSSFRLPAPNVFGCFEATVGVLGASVILLGTYLICAWKLPCKDAAKPLFLVLAIASIVSVAGSITLLMFSESMQIASPAYSVQMYARYVSFMSLLFGGGFHLISSAKVVRTENASAGCTTWFVHFAIVLTALAVLFGSRAYFLDNVILLLANCLPLIGLIFLLISFVIGYGLAGRANDSETKENPTRTGFLRLALSFATPAVMIAVTRGEEGVTLLIRVVSNISRNSPRVYDRFGIIEAISTMSIIQWNRPIPDAIEMLLPIAIVLSALLFHPSMKSFFCRPVDKTKICPVTEEIAPESSTAPQPMMMMNPMMPMPQQMMAPPNMACYNNQMPTASHLNIPASMSASIHMLPQNQTMMAPMVMPNPQPILSAQLPAYPSTMHGMGGRPIYMMA